jgi:hypothetical protein
MFSKQSSVNMEVRRTNSTRHRRKPTMFTFFAEANQALLSGLALYQLSLRRQATPEFLLASLRAAVQEMTNPSPDTNELEALDIQPVAA